MADYTLMGGQPASTQWREKNGQLVPTPWPDDDPRRADLHVGTQVKALNSGHTEASLIKHLTDQVSAPFSGPLDFFKDLFDGIGEILGGVFSVPIALLGGIIDGVRGLIDGIANGIKGNLPTASPFSAVRDAFLDGQKELTDRVDLLGDVEGYAQAYMSRNQNAQWGNSGWRTMIFDEKLGPAKGAAVTSDGYIELGSKGLWQVNARTTADSASWGGHPDLVMEVDVLRPDGSTFSQKRIETHSYFTGNSIKLDSYEKTVETTFPVVIPAAGYKVRVRCKAGQWRWWKGGTRYSMLAVTKFSREVGANFGSDTVSNETEAQVVG